MNVVASLLRSVVTYIPMFDGMTEADIDALAVGTEMSAYQLNDVVYSKGELGDKFFIVLKGNSIRFFDLFSVIGNYTNRNIMFN